MSEAPLTDGQDPSKASDAQKIAIYIAKKMLATGGIGNVSISDANRPVVAGDIVIFDGSTGLKIKDSGFSPSDFLTVDDADDNFQTSKRFVAFGETLTIRSRHGLVMPGDFTVEAGGTLVLESDANLLII